LDSRSHFIVQRTILGCGIGNTIFYCLLSMAKLTLFPEEETKRMLGELAIPVHTTEALDNYFFRGWQPGGFLTSILTNDLYGAVRSADYANKHVIYEIVQWLTLEPIVPENSWGAKEHVSNWLHDSDGIRTKFVEKIEKEYIWKTLKG